MAEMSVSVRVAAVLWWVNGVGFGVFCLPGIRNLVTRREVPVAMGFKAFWLRGGCCGGPAAC